MKAYTLLISLFAAYSYCSFNTEDLYYTKEISCNNRIEKTETISQEQDRARQQASGMIEQFESMTLTENNNDQNRTENKSNFLNRVKKIPQTKNSSSQHATKPKRHIKTVEEVTREINLLANAHHRANASPQNITDSNPTY